MWCRHCIQGKSRRQPHRLVDRSGDIIPIVGMDFYFPSDSSGKALTAEDRGDREVDEILKEASGTAVVLRDSKSGTIFSHVIPSKSLEETGTARQITDDIENLGYKRLLKVEVRLLEKKNRDLEERVKFLREVMIRDEKKEKEKLAEENSQMREKMQKLEKDAKR